MTNEIETKKKTTPEKQKESLHFSVSGSFSEEFTNIVGNQALNSAWYANSDKETKDQQMEAIVVALKGIAPNDEIEGMLAAQMIAVHNAAMECFRRGMGAEQSFLGRDMNIKHATKLTRSYTALVDSLQKYRGKGQQKMTVEHVHVHNGGQAIVGNVDREK